VRASALLVTAFACMLAASTPARAGAAGQRTVLNYGDSLAVGTQLYLGEYLGGWRVRAETEVSRHAADVPGALRSLGSALPRVVVVSAGTNDDPGTVSRFARTVREAVAVAGSGRCVVWATVVRPPYAGVSYGTFDDEAVFIGGLAIQWSQRWSTTSLWDGHNLHHIIEAGIDEQQMIGVVIVELDGKYDVGVSYSISF